MVRNGATLKIALIGQPNCGKSTLFNHLVGYKANTSNLPGTTVEYLRSEAVVAGHHLELIDLPGTYSLVPLDEAEAETRNFLVSESIDAVLNVVDASLLSRSLELTLQMLELDVPVVLCLNMMDEARRKGINIDVDALSRRLGIPVVATVAVRGTGVQEAVAQTIRAAQNARTPTPVPYSADIEAAIRRVAKLIATDSARLLAIKLIEGDPYFRRLAGQQLPGLEAAIQASQQAIQSTRGRPADQVISAERHAQAMEVFESAATVGAPIRTLRDRVDRVLMHRTFGLIALAGILYSLFFFVFKIGTAIETPLYGLFFRLVAWLGGVLPADGLAFAALRGLLEGVGGGLAIVLPYLVPFLFGLALLEDIGYLPRAGYLADGLMHRIGLHGKSIIPFILGYGCSVPAVMATRILENKRDRFITAMLAIMVPCVARTTVIYGLVGYFIGPHLAFALYVINILVIAITGRILTKLLPSVTPGLILEIPSYKVPSLRVMGAKMWMRIREFLRYAMPILVLGSIVMSVLEYFDVSRFLNALVLPITWSLGLPMAVGVPLVFGIFRKELSLVMLFSALGTMQVASVLSSGQMFVFALFTLFYIPCVATIAVLHREFGTARTATVIGATTGTALIVGLIARGVWALF
ncbi:ferrous iron transport protein B [Candidatus Bipolaricaulota bacterium]|nr:ferrous iron transport protein B [Candidatus Bipolaricaulota bacterium]